MDEKEYLEEMEPIIRLDMPENGASDEEWEKYWLRRSNDLRCSVELVQYICRLERRIAEMDTAIAKVNDVAWATLEYKMEQVEKRLERRMDRLDESMGREPRGGL